MSASLIIQTIRLQPTTAAMAALSSATTVKTQEHSDVWRSLLMTLANNTFYMSANNKKSFAFSGNSTVLHKPQIQYFILSSESNKNDCYPTESLIYLIKQQQQIHLQHYHAKCRIYSYCCRHRYRQITSGLRDAINPQITANAVKDTTNNWKVYCEIDTRTMITNENFYEITFFVLKPSPNPSLLLTFDHESHSFLLPAICPVNNPPCFENGVDTVTIENINNSLIKVTEDNEPRYNKTKRNLYDLSALLLKRQMLMKWFMSSLQGNCNHLSEQDISILTLQYCNNLINVGVLKQISEKNDLETFKPFQMYQWTHTEAPTISQPHTPGKLDKVSSWPYSSTPTATVSRLSKAIPVDLPQSERDSSFMQILKKRLLSCSTIAEVHVVVNDMLSVGEPIKRPSKRCILLTDLLNSSESTVYEFNKNKTDSSCRCEVRIQETGIQTEKVSQAIKEFVCNNCKDGRPYLKSSEITKCDKEIQVSLKEESNENKEDTEDKEMPKIPQPISDMGTPVPTFTIPPPPPPPPTASLTHFTPPPPPPPLPSTIGPSPALPPGTALIPTPLTLNTSIVPLPPPPDAAKSPSTLTPAPLPNPAEGGWFCQTNTLRKTAVNPPKPMKPLYWTRIVTNTPQPKLPKTMPSVAVTADDAMDFSTSSTSPDELVSSESNSTPKEIWQEIDETNLDNIDEFTELFSREVVVPKVIPKIKTEVRVRPIKVLDSKRSQNVGILMRSSHVEFCEIEHAIYHVDTSVVSLETLQQINKNKATDDELERIKEQGDIPLDEPEQFLLKISKISMFTERISCMVFMAEFEEMATIVERKLEVVLQLSQFLMESEELKLIFAIILTLGNYMNGGNRQRGQADGFTLEILSKLKDVKSKDSQTTLLHFIVRTYIGRKRKEGVQLLEIPLPIPEPSDVERATQVEFNEVKEQIAILNDQLNAKKRTTKKVILHSTDKNIEPFKSKMEEFVKNASKQIDKLCKELEDCRQVFIDTMQFYHYVPKSGTLEQCTPKKFFEHWTNFTIDFKDIMKKEIAILWNDLLKKSKDVQSRKTVRTTKVKPGGLKERIMRLNKK